MRGLALRWSLLAATLSVLLMVAVLVLATGPNNDWAQAEATRQVLQQHVTQVKRRLDDGIRERQNAILTLSRMPVSREQLESLQNADPAYAWIGLTNADGRVLIATDGLLEEVDVSARPWFTGARGGPFTADVHQAVLLAKLLDPQRPEPPRFIDIAVPVTREGEFAGVLGAHLYSEWLEQVAQASSPNLQEVGGEVMLLSQDGTVQVGPGSLRGQRVVVDRAMGKVMWPDGRAYIWHADVAGSRSAGARWTVLARAPMAQTFLEAIWNRWAGWSVR
jgi:hypothetical protein